MAAMQNPWAERMMCPTALSANFFIFNMVLPSILSINDMYGQMLNGRFPQGSIDDFTLDVIKKLTEGTIALWRTMQKKMLPTPAKFHYIFNLRELSRVFQGIMSTPSETVKTGGFRVEEGLTKYAGGAATILRIWKHECERTFSDKLTNLKDKAVYAGFMEAQIIETFGEDLALKLPTHSTWLISYAPTCMTKTVVWRRRHPRCMNLEGTWRRSAQW